MNLACVVYVSITVVCDEKYSLVCCVQPVLVACVFVQSLVVCEEWPILVRDKIDVHYPLYVFC